ncbi:CCNL [Lepeophtheirus salmonis]|uniref:CCNL n=1 Tax=Lepeophtheirus salmonis TaxID=72036 RepID=A0A7R8H6K6_LEPSM|nr:CCNL [Lepeophtheirus salmonis]CAF2890644.1 CCNL [Lepeophtheirus salmonis]
MSREAGTSSGQMLSSKKKFGSIKLDISNSVLPLEKLGNRVSSRDGLAQELETACRNSGCDLIQLAGKLLRLPQVAMATGCVLLQRFYYAKSIVYYPFDIVAMACLVLASKIEESPRRIRDIINVFTHIKQVRNSQPIVPVSLDQNYVNLKNQVIKAERRVLKELGFCVHVKHPHKIIVMYLKWLELDTNKELLQMSWNFMNDSLRTDIFVRYPPECVATACIYLSARKLKVPLPKNPAWFDCLGVEEDDIKDCCYRMICLYNLSENPTPSDSPQAANILGPVNSSATTTTNDADDKTMSQNNHLKDENYRYNTSKDVRRSSRTPEKKKKRKDRSESRSSSYDDSRRRKKSKKYRRKSMSRSPSESVPRKKSKKTHKDKFSYSRSRSRSKERSRHRYNYHRLISLSSYVFLQENSASLKLVVDWKLASDGYEDFLLEKGQYCSFSDSINGNFLLTNQFRT